MFIIILLNFKLQWDNNSLTQMELLRKYLPLFGLEILFIGVLLYGRNKIMKE